MYKHADRIQESLEIHRAKDLDKDDSDDEDNELSCFDAFVEPFKPFLETSQTHWHVLEQQYYALNKHTIEEELNDSKKASVDIGLMEHQIRRIAAALEVEQTQRRTLEDRLYAYVNQNDKFEDETETTDL